MFMDKNTISRCEYTSNSTEPTHQCISISGRNKSRIYIKLQRPQIPRRSKERKKEKENPHFQISKITTKLE